MVKVDMLGILLSSIARVGLPTTSIGSVPTTPDPNTFAKYRDTNGSRIVIQIGDVYTTLCQEGGILLQKYAIEMGGVSRYFSKVSGSGVDLTLLTRVCAPPLGEA